MAITHAAGDPYPPTPKSRRSSTSSYMLAPLNNNMSRATERNHNADEDNCYEDALEAGYEALKKNAAHRRQELKSAIEFQQAQDKAFHDMLHEEEMKELHRLESARLNVKNLGEQLIMGMKEEFQARVEHEYREELRQKFERDRSAIEADITASIENDVRAELRKDLLPVIKAELSVDLHDECANTIRVDIFSNVYEDLKEELRILHEPAIRAELRAKISAEYEPTGENTKVQAFAKSDNKRRESPSYHPHSPSRVEEDLPDYEEIEEEAAKTEGQKREEQAMNAVDSFLDSMSQDMDKVAKQNDAPNAYTDNASNQESKAIEAANPANISPDNVSQNENEAAEEGDSPNALLDNVSEFLRKVSEEKKAKIKAEPKDDATPANINLHAAQTASSNEHLQALTANHELPTNVARTQDERTASPAAPTHPDMLSHSIEAVHSRAPSPTQATVQPPAQPTAQSQARSPLQSDNKPATQYSNQSPIQVKTSRKRSFVEKYEDTSESNSSDAESNPPSRKRLRGMSEGAPNDDDHVYDAEVDTDDEAADQAQREALDSAIGSAGRSDGYEGLNAQQRQYVENIMRQHLGSIDDSSDSSSDSEDDDDQVMTDEEEHDIEDQEMTDEEDESDEEEDDVKDEEMTDVEDESEEEQESETSDAATLPPSNTKETAIVLDSDDDDDVNDAGIA